MLDPPQEEGIRQLLILSILKWTKNKAVKSQDGSSTINYIVKVMRERRRPWVEIYRHSRGLDLHIQGRGSQRFQSSQLFLGQSTHQHVGQPYAGGVTATLIYRRGSFSPEWWVSNLLKADHSA